MLLQAMLGLQQDAPRGKLYVDPALPDWLPDVTLTDLRLGRQRFDIRFWRDGKNTLFKVLTGSANGWSGRASRCPQARQEGDNRARLARQLTPVSHICSATPSAAMNLCSLGYPIAEVPEMREEEWATTAICACDTAQSLFHSRCPSRGLADDGVILGSQSGSGDHTVHFRERFPDFCFPTLSDLEPDAVVSSVAAWVKTTHVTNVRAPIALNASHSVWPIASLTRSSASTRSTFHRGRRRWR